MKYKALETFYNPLSGQYVEKGDIVEINTDKANTFNRYLIPLENVINNLQKELKQEPEKEFEEVIETSMRVEPKVEIKKETPKKKR